LHSVTLKNVSFSPLLFPSLETQDYYYPWSDSQSPFFFTTARLNILFPFPELASAGREPEIASTQSTALSRLRVDQLPQLPAKQRH
jgi:hypothetical protein